MIPPASPRSDRSMMTPDGKSYVYGFHRTLGDLYLVEGLK